MVSQLLKAFRLHLSLQRPLESHTEHANTKSLLRVVHIRKGYLHFTLHASSYVKVPPAHYDST